MQFAKRGLAVAFVALAMLRAAASADRQSGAYAAAAYVADGLEHETQHLMVFQPGGQTSSIPIPVHIKALAYGPQGTALYATIWRRLAQPAPPFGLLFGLPQGLVRIGLKPLRVTEVSGSAGFTDVASLAASPPEDKLFVSAHYNDAQGEKCGLFELGLPDGRVRAIMESSHCSGIWSGTIVSPDGGRAVVSRSFPPGPGSSQPPLPSRMELMDLASGTSVPLGDYWGASWSPNGRWIAALQTSSGQHTAIAPGGSPIPVGHSITVLIDAQDLSRRRDLGGLNDDEVIWSPDSRYILHALWRHSCGDAHPLSLEAIDVETGQRAIIKGSECKLINRLSAAAKNGAILAGEKGPVVRLRHGRGPTLTGVFELWLVALRQPATIRVAPGPARVLLSSSKRPRMSSTNPT